MTVRGNWDTFIARDAVQPFEGGQWARDELTDDDVHWLAALPNTHELVMSGKRIRLLHASQTSEFVRVRVQHTRDEFLGMFSNTPFTGEFRAGEWPQGTTPDVVGYGDIHGTYLAADDGLMLFNAGAVGNHLDGPSAPYVILEGVVGSVEPESFSVSFVRVPYDIEAEVAVARDLAHAGRRRLCTRACVRAPTGATAPRPPDHPVRLTTPVGPDRAEVRRKSPDGALSRSGQPGTPCRGPEPHERRRPHPWQRRRAGAA